MPHVDNSKFMAGLGIVNLTLLTLVQNESNRPFFM